MKDLRKVKKKYIFELGNKQMTLVFAGLIVIGLLIFSAGAMVGSRVAQSKMAAESKQDVRAKIRAPSLLKEKVLAEKETSPAIEDIIEQSTSKAQNLSIARKEDAPAQAEKVKTAGEPAGGKPAVMKAKEPAGEKGYFVQVAAFQNLEDAERQAKSLTDKGYKIIVVKADIAGKGTWHRVRLGPFDDLDKAKSFAIDFEKKEKIKTYIPMN